LFLEVRNLLESPLNGPGYGRPWLRDYIPARRARGDGSAGRLPGRIIEGRPYRSVEDLDRVKGIGKKRLEEIRQFVSTE
jgi:hypothetical protein